MWNRAVGRTSWLRMNPGCAHCSAAGGCGAALNSDKKAVKALNRAGAKKGDPVSVVYGSGSLKTAALVYIFPLALMIVGAALGSVLGVQFHLARETASVIFGFWWFGGWIWYPGYSFKNDE